MSAVERGRAQLDQDLAGARVVLTAQRRADEFAAALERRGATVVHAPTMSHIPHVDDPELISRTKELVATGPDIVVITTGIGFRGWLEAADAAGLAGELRATLAKARIVARGPKARGAIQGEGLAVDWTAESETAEEIKDVLLDEGVQGRRVAVQHHGAGSDGIDEALAGAGADVVSLVVYRWGPAPDPSAVQTAVGLVARAEVDCVAFTAAPGAQAFLDAAQSSGELERVVDALRSRSVLAAAVGDTTAVPLRVHGIEPLVPDRFRMGALVRAIVAELGARRAGSIRSCMSTEQCAVVLTAHGTASPAGQAVVRELVAAIEAARPDLLVRDAYVDVQDPKVADAVAELAPHHEEVVVVPLLFCGGYHVRVDVAKAVKPWENARSTGALGPSERLAQLMVERLAAAGATREDAVVMAAAGSSRAEANADARTQARMVSQVWGGPVDVGFGSAGTPRIHDAISANRERPGGRVVVASLLLGEGHFYSMLQSSGADLVTEPLGADPHVVAQILDRIEAPVR